MTRFGIILTVVAAGITATANLFLRKGLTQVPESGTGMQRLIYLLGDGFFVVGILLYGVAMLPWLKVVSTEPLGSAYPFVVGLTFVMLLFGVVFFFNEPLSFKKIAGAILIVVGITIVAQA